MLASDHPQLLVSTRDLGDRIEAEARAAAELAGGGDPRESRTGSLHARPRLATAFVEPRTETERAIAALWGELLGIAGVGAEDDFFELGGNSLLLMQVSTRLRSDVGIVLSMRDLFDTPTVTTLCRARRIAAAARRTRGRRGSGGRHAIGTTTRPRSSGCEDIRISWHACASST